MIYKIKLFKMDLDGMIAEAENKRKNAYLEKLRLETLLYEMENIKLQYKIDSFEREHNFKEEEDYSKDYKGDYSFEVEVYPKNKKDESKEKNYYFYDLIDVVKTLIPIEYDEFCNLPSHIIECANEAYLSQQKLKKYQKDNAMNSNDENVKEETRKHFANVTNNIKQFKRELTKHRENK
jgi:hypothetical protein